MAMMMQVVLDGNRNTAVRVKPPHWRYRYKMKDQLKVLIEETCISCLVNSIRIDHFLNVLQGKKHDIFELTGSQLPAKNHNDVLSNGFS